ncbi:rhodanese-like domain-containing protein [Ferrovibrio sp.]|uniref:rhodanese-like domain-containing protein n=1 Tax=Ferrovibrio sp. TaxID=1917215 RepID=UPI00311D744A
MDKPIDHSGQTTASISAQTLRGWLEAESAILIDVREPEEFADEYIPGAILVPLSGLDATALPEAPGKRRVLQCLSGKRSATALQRLAQQGITDLLHLEGGLLAWKIAGGRTIEADDDAVAA